MKKLNCTRVLGALVALFVSHQALADEVNVVTSIKPINSLVAAVMKGVGTPYLIVKGAASPHGYSMKPSDATALQEAKLVFWIGEDLERFLESPLNALSKKAHVVELSEIEGLKLHDLREGGSWEAHHHDHEELADHDDHDKHADHDDHDDHDKHADHDDHDEHEKHADHDEHEHHHEHGEKDMHIWLDPANAKAIVREAAHELAELDPKNAALYKSNADETVARLDKLEATSRKDLESVKHRPFIVFHDGYQYLEKAFDLEAVGSVTVSPEKAVSAKRVSEIKDKVSKLGAVCIFTEPQFTPKLVQTIAQGTKAKTSTLDPLGADIEDGPDLYFELLKRNVTSLKNCLSTGS